MRCLNRVNRRLTWLQTMCNVLKYRKILYNGALRCGCVYFFNLLKTRAVITLFLPPLRKQVMFRYKTCNFKDKATLTSYNGTIRQESARIVLPKSPYLKYPIHHYKGSVGVDVANGVQIKYWRSLSGNIKNSARAFEKCGVLNHTSQIMHSYRKCIEVYSYKNFLSIPFLVFEKWKVKVSDALEVWFSIHVVGTEAHPRYSTGFK